MIHPLIQRPRPTYNRRRRREEEFRNDSRKHYNDIDYLIEEKIQEIFKMEYDENNDNSKITLIHFFEEFLRVYDEHRAEDYSLLESEYEELSKKLQLEEQIYDELMNKLGDKLVTIQIHDLDLDMLRNNESSSFFRRKYDSLNQNGKEDILMKEIEKLEKEIKYNPFRKNKNQLLLAEKIEELERIQEAKTQAEEFESLTPEDKKEIIEYFLSKEKLSNLKLQLYNNSKERDEYNSPEIGVRRCIRTWNKMLNSGKISDEILDELFEKLDKVGLDTERDKNWGFNIGVQDTDNDRSKYWCAFHSFLESVRKVYQNAREEIDSAIKKKASSQGQTEVKEKKDEIGILEEDIEEVLDNDTLEKSKSTNNEIDSFRAQMEAYVELITEQKFKLYDEAERLGLDFEKEFDVARAKIALRNDMRAYFNGKKDITIEEINTRCTELGLDFYDEMDKARDEKLPIATDINESTQKVADRQLSRDIHQAEQTELKKEYREHENPDINKNIEIKG